MPALMHARQSNDTHHVSTAKQAAKRVAGMFFFRPTDEVLRSVCYV